MVNNTTGVDRGGGGGRGRGQGKGEGAGEGREGCQCETNVILTSRTRDFLGKGVRRAPLINGVFHSRCIT